MAYRNDVGALEARKVALDHEVVTKTQERDDAARLLAEAHARARLPVLDNIRIASPCTAAWNDMTGDDRVRHCGLCKKDVFNLSQMTRDEAEALIATTAGNLCARYYQRKDGTIILADCTIGKRQQRKRRFIVAGAAMLLAGGGIAWKLHRTDDKLVENTLLGQITPPTSDMTAIAGGVSFNPPPQAPPQQKPLHDVVPGHPRRK